MAEEPLADLVGRVLRDAPFAMRQLAADSGLSYDVLRSWRSGRRRPSRASVQRLAQGLEQRGHQLLQLSQELRESSGGQASSAERGVADETGAGAGAQPPTPEQTLAGGAVHGTAQTSIPPRSTGATHMTGGSFGSVAGGGTRQSEGRGQAAASGREEGDRGTSPGSASRSEQGGGAGEREASRAGGSQATDSTMAADSRDDELKPRRWRRDWGGTS